MTQLSRMIYFNISVKKQRKIIEIWWRCLCDSWWRVPALLCIWGCHCTNMAAACMESNKVIKIAQIGSLMFNF